MKKRIEAPIRKLLNNMITNMRQRGQILSSLGESLMSSNWLARCLSWSKRKTNKRGYTIQKLELIMRSCILNSVHRRNRKTKVKITHKMKRSLAHQIFAHHILSWEPATTVNLTQKALIKEVTTASLPHQIKLRFAMSPIWNCITRQMKIKKTLTSCMTADYSNYRSNQSWKIFTTLRNLLKMQLQFIISSMMIVKKKRNIDSFKKQYFNRIHRVTKQCYMQDSRVKRKKD